MNPKNAQLIDKLVKDRVITFQRVIDVMRIVDRGDFTPPSQAYMDRPQTIGFNATISAPHMHGYVLEWLHDYLTPGAQVLDVGSGSGYLTICMALMLGHDASAGKVIGVDHVPELV
jgi:protein-L-isoaspartate(D-aspartate) O-methyltransferase